MANMLILFYLFSDGKLEDNLVGIFNLFDADGNKVSLKLQVSSVVNMSDDETEIKDFVASFCWVIAV